MIYGADHKSIQTARGGPLAGGDIGTNMLPALVPGSDLKYDPYGIAKNDGAADVAKAKAELKKCGKPNGFKTTIAVRNNKQVEVASAEAMQASLKKVGIKAEVDEYDGAQTSGIIGNPDVVKKKNYGIIIMGWGPDFPSGQGYGMPLWHSKYILDNGNNNYAMIDDKKIDKACSPTRSPNSTRTRPPRSTPTINTEVMKGALLPALHLREEHHLALQPADERLHDRRLQRPVRLRHARCQVTVRPLTARRTRR